MKYYSWLFFIFFVFGCSSSPKIDTHQYLLNPDTHNAASDNTQHDLQGSKQIIIVEPITLATYLNQRGIVLLTDKHEIKVAHYHRWAEPLDENIHRYMLTVLSESSSRFAFQAASRSTAQNAHLKLHITIDQFKGTSDGRALVAGDWQLNDTKENTPIAADSFSYEESLAESGYIELVNQLALMLDKASLKILDTINSKQ
jgi:uncharacterized lipoprotein YmbA